jgi:hypothetical protein
VDRLCALTTHTNVFFFFAVSALLSMLQNASCGLRFRASCGRSPRVPCPRTQFVSTSTMVIRAGPHCLSG